MKEHLIRASKNLLIVMIALLAFGLWVKHVTAINTDTVDTVTIKYVQDYSTYSEQYLGGYTRAVTSKSPAVLEEWIDLLEEMNQRKLVEDGPVLDPPAFPCYIVEYKYGRTVEAYMSVGMVRAVINKYPRGARSIYYGPDNVYYDRIGEMMAELEALAN